MISGVGKVFGRYCSFIPESVIPMPEQEIPVSVAQSIIIRFLAQGVKPAEVLECLLGRRLSANEIAREVGISYGTIFSVITKRVWV